MANWSRYEVAPLETTHVRLVEIGTFDEPFVGVARTGGVGTAGMVVNRHAEE